LIQIPIYNSQAIKIHGRSDQRKKLSRNVSFNEDRIVTMIPESRAEPQSPQAVVIVRDVVQSYGGPKVLDNFSMNVQKGSM